MELQTIKADVKQIIKESTELIQLQDIEETKRNLEQIAKKYADTSVTMDNYNDARDARKTIRDYRYALQNIDKHNAKILNNARRENKELIDGLIDIIRPTEDIIHEGILKIDKEKERIKKEEEQKELQRIADINKKLSDTRNHLSYLIEYGSKEKDLESFKNAIDDLQKGIADDVFQEFTFEAQNMVDHFSSELGNLEEKILEAISNERHNKRKAELASVWKFIKDPNMNFGDLSEEEFNTIKADAEEAEAEAKRKAEAEKQRLLEQKRIQKELEEKLRKQQQELDAQRKAFEEEMRKAKEEQLEKERIANEAKLEAERKEQEKKAKAEAERKRKEERERLRTLCARYEVKMTGKSNEELKIEVREAQEKIRSEKIKEIKKDGEKHLEFVSNKFDEIRSYFETVEVSVLHEDAVESLMQNLGETIEELKTDLTDI